MPFPYNHAETKEKIISAISTKGPILPVHIARLLSIEPLFASAFLSELYEENRLRMSHMKVGSSSLYILPGQEEQLEKFIEHLNQREKEAFFLLKKEKLLEDDQQTPVVRVALRSIKDFAIPIKINKDNAEKVFWKYHLVKDSDVKTILDEKSGIFKQPIVETPVKKQEKIEEPKVEKVESTPKAIEVPIEKEEQKLVKKKTKEEKESKFQMKVKQQLSSSGIELTHLFIDKSKEMMGKVRTNDKFGMQHYFFTAKDKKKISPEDLSSTYEKAHSEKMPALFISNGELDKKAIETLKEWGNLIKFERLKSQL